MIVGKINFCIRNKDLPYTLIWSFLCIIFHYLINFVVFPQISLQREKLAQIEDARQKEESTKNDLTRLCHGLQDEARLFLVQKILNSGCDPEKKTFKD